MTAIDHSSTIASMTSIGTHRPLKFIATSLAKVFDHAARNVLQP